MKDPSEWQEDDLQSLIDSGAEESITREFKRADSLGVPGKPELDEGKKTEISKDVSAMANSAGGIIVYGIAEHKDPPHPADSLSPVDPKQFSKDWLEQVINSRVKPLIQGLLIHPIQLSGTHAGQVAYLVAVPQSSTAHQGGTDAVTCTGFSRRRSSRSRIK